MTHTRPLIATALLLATAAGTALAQVYTPAPADRVDNRRVVLVDDDRGPYAGVGVSTLEFNQYALSGKLGYNLNEFFGVEAEAGFGISEEDDQIDGFELGAGIDYYAAGFVVGRLPLSEQFDVLGRAGYYFAEVDASVLDVTSNLTTDLDADTDGFAFGVGGQFNFGEAEKNGIRVEYTYLDVQEVENVDVDDLDLGSDLWSVSYIRKF